MRCAFFDVDGTLVSEGTWDILLSYPSLGKAAKRRVYADVLPVWLGAKLGVNDDARFRQRWVRAVARRMEGWTRAQTDALFDWLVSDQLANGFRANVVLRLQQHVEQGDHAVLVSGMYEEIVQRFAAQLGAQAGVGSLLVYNGNICAGTIEGAGCIGEHKPLFIKRYLQARGYEPDYEQSYAYADSYSDVPMLSSVGHPVATYPDEQLRGYAQSQGWEVLAG